MTIKQYWIKILFYLNIYPDSEVIAGISRGGLPNPHTIDVARKLNYEGKK